MTPEERTSLGKVLNSVKQELETGLDSRKAALESVALDARLAREWFDLTTPAPGIRPGHRQPITQVQREIEELLVSLGLHGYGRT